MERIADYWVDLNGNKWSCERYTKEEAQSISLGMSNCKNCINCINCKNCESCEECVDCIDCKNCGQCRNLVNCVHCTITSNIMNKEHILLGKLCIPEGGLL